MEAAGGVHLVDRNDAAGTKPFCHLSKKSSRLGLVYQDVSAHDCVEIRVRVVRFEITVQKLDIAVSEVAHSLPCSTEDLLVVVDANDAAPRSD